MVFLALYAYLVSTIWKRDSNLVMDSVVSAMRRLLMVILNDNPWKPLVLNVIFSLLNLVCILWIFKLPSGYLGNVRGHSWCEKQSHG